MSVDISYLPNAVRHGTRVISDALVERVLFSGDRATGVEGKLLNTKSDSPLRFTVKAKVVVIACGTLHSPLLLQASGANNVHIGKHVTLHPASRVCAFFDEKLNGWDGALQSVYSNHFEKEGITLVGAYSPPNVLVAGLPGFGPAHRKLARELPFLGVFGGMIHDEGGGMVRQAPFGREGVVSYEMAPRDLTRLRQAMVILGEMAFAAGARQVILPVFGVPPIRDLKMLRKIHSEPLDARRIECLAFHPLGSARMANDPRRGVCDTNGLVYGTKGLYVADGSVLPTSIGVNSQVPIMTIATQVAWGIREQLKPSN